MPRLQPSELSAQLKLSHLWKLNGGGSEDITFNVTLPKAGAYLFVSFDVSGDWHAEVSLWSHSEWWEDAIVMWEFPTHELAVMFCEQFAKHATYVVQEPYTTYDS